MVPRERGTEVWSTGAQAAPGVSQCTRDMQRKMVTQDRLKFKFFLSLNSNIGD